MLSIDNEQEKDMYLAQLGGLEPLEGYEVSLKECSGYTPEDPKLHNEKEEETRQWRKWGPPDE